MTRDDRIELLRQAETELESCIHNIETALRDTPEESHANAYILGHLRTWLGNGNPYDKGIDKYIDEMYEWDEEMDDENEPNENPNGGSYESDKNI